MSRYRNFMLTLFKWLDEPIDEKGDYSNLIWPDFIEYAHWQLEMAPTTENPHLQVYVELKNPRSVKSVSKAFMNAHVEPRSGSQQQAIDYCSKEDTRLNGPYSWGIPNAQGSRTDMALFISAIRDGSSVTSMLDDHASNILRYGRGMDRIRSIIPPPRRPNLVLIFYYGVSGAGKSYKAHFQWPDAYTYTDNSNGWFDGYDNQKVVIMDEFSGLTPLPLMLKLLDPYPHRMPIKGGFVPIYADTIVFTTNTVPQHLYYGDPWSRRVKGSHQEHFTQVYGGGGTVLPSTTSVQFSLDQNSGFRASSEKKSS